jgi:hypothetical protein
VPDYGRAGLLQTGFEEIVMRVLAARSRAEPLRMATLAVLFTATMLAAIIVPRQIHAVLSAAATGESDISASIVKPLG